MAARAELPSGTVTFLFTDIEGSTRLLHELGDRYGDVLAQHRRVIREAFQRHGGVEVDTQGDAFLVAFARASDAVAGAREAQAGLRDGPVRVRMGLHTGEPSRGEEGYVGVDVHRGARVAAAGHGGQVLLSQPTRDLLDSSFDLVDLGLHRLKDLSEPQRLYQLGSEQFPPLKTLHQTNLPVPATPFLGRERELGEVLALLRSSRMLTLTGPGGSGKTRLAAQAAAEVAGNFPGGVWWVSLSAVTDPAFVVESIVQVLGAKGELAEHIADNELLLLLDNLEQLLAAARELAALLQRCSRLKLLVTSRESLRVAAEQEYPVPPFVSEEAVGFFSARARAVRPDFQPDEAVAEVCHRLDNLPLALELAAARVKVLEPEQILARLERRLPLLTGGRRDAPERQQTLAATIAWSYDLLSQDEQRLFARLSVFAGGCRLEAAEDVADADLETLSSLVDKSLLRHTEERFWMLETIREYALERLQDSDDAEALRERFFGYWLALGEGVEFGSRDPGWLERAQLEYDNLRAALEGSPAPELSLRLAVALAEFWLWKGHAREGRSWLARLLAATDDAPEDLQARGKLVAAELAVFQDDYSAASALLDDAEPRLQAVGDFAGIVQVRLMRGWTAFLTGDLQAAARLLEEAMETARSRRLEHLLPRALRMLAVVEDRRGNAERSKDLQEESLARYRELGDDVGIGMILADLAWNAILRGDYDSARLLAEESLWLAGGSMAEGADPSIQHTLALALLGLGSGDEALKLARRALRGAWERPDVLCCSALLDLLAAVAAERGADERAARLMGAAEALLEGIGAPTTELQLARRVYGPLLERARERLGASAWDTARTAGATQAIPAAVEYALQSGNSGTASLRPQTTD